MKHRFYVQSGSGGQALCVAIACGGVATMSDAPEAGACSPLGSCSCAQSWRQKTVRAPRQAPPGRVPPKKRRQRRRPLRRRPCCKHRVRCCALANHDCASAACISMYASIGVSQLDLLSLMCAFFKGMNVAFTIRARCCGPTRLDPSARTNSSQVD